MQHEKLSVGGGLGALLLAAAGFSWGFVIVKYLGLPAGTIAFYRTLIGAVALGVVVGIFRIPRPVRLFPVIGAGVCFGAHQLIFIEATQTTTIAHVTLIGALQPLLVSLVSHRAVGERPPAALKWWALVAVVGVGLVVWANLGDPSRSLGGDLLSVLNLFVFTAFFLFSKKARQQGTHTVALTAGMLAVSVVVVSPALAFVEVRAAQMGWQWGLLALLALGPGNGHLLVNWAHRRISAALASIVLTAIPLLASLWAHLVLDEPFGLRHVGGAVLVALAIEGSRRAEAARAREAAERDVEAAQAVREEST